MLKAPSKPVEQMTSEEFVEWKNWLLAEGQNPRTIVFAKPISGSEYAYDPILRAVVETTPEGARYAVELRDGEVIRARLLTSPSLAEVLES